MNQQMWMNPATRANCALLLERGIRLAGPASGSQACGETGPGRMMEPADLVAALSSERNGGIGRKARGGDGRAHA